MRNTSHVIVSCSNNGEFIITENSMNHRSWAQGAHAEAILRHSIEEAPGAVWQMLGSHSKNEGGLDLRLWTPNVES